MNEYSFEISTIDTHVALDCEAQRAEREGMTVQAARQRVTALHIRNAQAHMTDLCPAGHRVRARIVFDVVPDVNAVLRDDVRNGAAFRNTPTTEEVSK